tara:strand:- start:1450 stop:1614 length:165 start_codon:yes stop_codon:yes gene_type:complete
MKQYLIKNSLGVFFIGFLISFLEDITGFKYIFSFLGLIIMLFSFYLMSLKSKQK